MRTVIGEGRFDKILNTHYSQAIRVNNLVFVAGQLPVDDNFNIMSRGDVGAQAQKVFENMKSVLAEAGATMQDVVQVEIFVKNIRHLPIIAPARREYFGQNRPVATLVEINELVHPDALIEVSAIAVIDSASQ
ncbi:RidA family protein [Acidobacteria bacterium AH-259-G07]|nr:RidA family protein [Acidobacteria bacterium AH-259-G07]